MTLRTPHIPDHLAEYVAAMVRICKNAQEGDRLPAVQERFKKDYPDLGEADLKEVTRLTAILLTLHLPEEDRRFARRASKLTLERATQDETDAGLEPLVRERKNNPKH